MDARAAWRYESDRNVAQTMTMAMRWLERHYKEDFFLYVDTLGLHERLVGFMRDTGVPDRLVKPRLELLA